MKFILVIKEQNILKFSTLIELVESRAKYSSGIIMEVNKAHIKIMYNYFNGAEEEVQNYMAHMAETHPYTYFKWSIDTNDIIVNNQANNDIICFKIDKENLKKLAHYLKEVREYKFVRIKATTVEHSPKEKINVLELISENGLGNKYQSRVVFKLTKIKEVPEPIPQNEILSIYEDKFDYMRDIANYIDSIKDKETFFFISILEDERGVKIKINFQNKSSICLFYDEVKCIRELDENKFYKVGVMAFLEAFKASYRSDIYHSAEPVMIFTDDYIQFYFVAKDEQKENYSSYSIRLETELVERKEAEDIIKLEQ